MTIIDAVGNVAAKSLGSYPDVDGGSCQLLGQTALIVQGLLGIFVILSLVYKRHRESPKRPWRIWLFDVSKQVAGQMFIHGTNLLVAGLTSHNDLANACVSYFLNILIDTTLGVALIYYTLNFLTRLFTETFKMEGFQSGVYGTPPSFSFWARQAALYVTALVTMKAIVVALLVVFPALYGLGEWLLEWTGDGDLQVVFVMGIFPIIMNIVQFWLIDSIVKASTIAYTALDVESGPEPDTEPLFDASDDEDDGHPRRLSAPHSVISFDPSTLNQGTTTTGRTTPEDPPRGAKSSPGSLDDHAYPPSLSSSMSSNASSAHDPQAPKVARNLMKKMQKRTHTNPNSPQSATHSPAPAEGWDSWGDEHEWSTERNVLDKAGVFSNAGPRTTTT